MEKLKNDIISNYESWPEIFGITEAEVLEIMNEIRQYQDNNQSYMDWCLMYNGIHRESTYENHVRGWLACYRWMQSKQANNEALLSVSNQEIKRA